MRIFLPAFLIGIAALATTPAHAARCYKLILKDESGAVIPTAAPVVGLMLGKNPIIDGPVPAHAKREPAAPVACPASLVDGIHNLYNTSCVTEAAREKAAAENNTSVDVVKSGCADMSDALQGKDEDIFPKKPGAK